MSPLKGVGPSTRQRRVASPGQPAQPSRWIEIAIGWSLAACLHPIAAWRVFSARGRVLIAMGYFAGAYVAVLTAMLILA